MGSNATHKEFSLYPTLFLVFLKSTLLKHHSEGQYAEASLWSREHLEMLPRLLDTNAEGPRTFRSLDHLTVRFSLAEWAEDWPDVLLPLRPPAATPFAKPAAT